MKKTYLFLASMFLLFSCSNDEVFEQSEAQFSADYEPIYELYWEITKFPPYPQYYCVSVKVIGMPRLYDELSNPSVILWANNRSEIISFQQSQWDNGRYLIQDEYKYAPGQIDGDVIIGTGSPGDSDITKDTSLPYTMYFVIPLEIYDNYTDIEIMDVGFHVEGNYFYTDMYGNSTLGQGEFYVYEMKANFERVYLK